MKIQEGYMSYLGYKTYYRIVGERRTDKPPVIFLHGGPGSSHNYFELLDDLAETGRQLIMYDQLGCGKSFVSGHPELWTAETWANELIALREHLNLDEIHLLGQSWGGMLAIIYACDYAPKGIKSLILSSTLSSAELWAQEQHRMIRLDMTPEEQAAIRQAEDSGNFAEPNYVAANARYMILHCTDEYDENSPEPLRREKASGAESYLAGWGPNEYNPQGSLKGYKYTDKLSTIQIPAFVISGTNDLCTPLVAKTMYDVLPNAKWELFAHSRHMPFYDEPEKYLKLLQNWLAHHD